MADQGLQAMDTSGRPSASPGGFLPIPALPCGELEAESVTTTAASSDIPPRPTDSLPIPTSKNIEKSADEPSKNKTATTIDHHIDDDEVDEELARIQTTTRPLKVVQEQLHTKWVEETKALLARVGLSPPLLQNRVFWLYEELAADPNTPDSYLPRQYRESDENLRRLLAYSCVRQAIQYYEENKRRPPGSTERDGTCQPTQYEPIDPAWVWDLGPNSKKDLGEHPTFRNFLYHYEKGEEDNVRALADLPPPMFFTSDDLDEKLNVVLPWVRNVIYPLSDWIFAKQSWKFAPDKELSEEDKWYKELLECKKATWITACDHKDLALFPNGFLEASPAEQRRMAITLGKARKHKFDILVTLAGIALQILEPNHGDLRGFRTSNSPSIKKAAAEAWDEHERGPEYFPYQGDLFCCCETEEEHRLEGIEKVGIELVKKANKHDERIALEAAERLSAASRSALRPSSG